MRNTKEFFRFTKQPSSTKLFYSLSILILIAVCFHSCKSSQFCFNTTSPLEHSKAKISQSLKNLEDPAETPRNIKKGEKHWNTNGIESWTSGFYPGLLWYMYDYTGDEFWKEQAHRFTMQLEPIKELDWKTHDFGFMMFNSFGNGYKQTHNPEYKDILLETADSLATLFNPTVGTIHSWPWMVRRKNWPHNTIIDNMMNLELLFWASKNGGRKELYEIAETHALTTMKNHFREDHTAYHVVVYDTTSGQPLKKVTDQGYNDASVWSRGQGWAIYGFAVSYRETRRQEFLDFAKKVTDAYIERLPEDYVPYWDFHAPNIPDEPKDASAAALAAAGMLEMIPFLEEQERKKYWKVAIKTLESLSSEDYLSEETNNAILLHSTGSKPHDSEVDVSLVYADYYYVEALMKARELRNKFPELCK
jgi:unsaturated chondroitin disaccharide hydrolase